MTGSKFSFYSSSSTSTWSAKASDEVVKEVSPSITQSISDSSEEDAHITDLVNETHMTEDGSEVDAEVGNLEEETEEEETEEEETEEIAETISDVSEPTKNAVANYSAALSEKLASLKVVAAASTTNLDNIATSKDLSDEVASLQPTLTSSASSEITHKLEEYMVERIQSIDAIRSLLEGEKENDSSRADALAKMRMLYLEDIASKDGTIDSLGKHVAKLKAKNKDYAQQLSRLSVTVNELVEASTQNNERMTELDHDTAAKTKMIELMTKDINNNQIELGVKTKENDVLTNQLETFKAENESLKAAVEELTTKNTDYAAEVENILSSLREVVDQNAALEQQVEKLVSANQELETAVTSMNTKNTELLDTVDGLTDALNEARSLHKKDMNKLQQENDDMAGKLKEERETSEATIKEFEKIVEDTTSQMSEQMTNQKSAFAEQITGLSMSLDHASASKKKAQARNLELEDQIKSLASTSIETADSTFFTLSQLEEDIDEEFQVATKLKRTMDGLKMRAFKDGNEKLADEVEGLLSSLRMIQCWQLSHFQRINKLASKNNEHSHASQAWA